MSSWSELLIYSYAEYVSLWYVVGFAATGYLLYYRLEVVKQPRLACAPGEFRSFLETNLPITKEKYWPTLWCWESRFQTILAHYIREYLIPVQPYRREVFTLSDGGQVALDWREGSYEPNAPILVALPGITGSSSMEYIRNLALTCYRIGVRCVIFNQRGLGGVDLKTSRIYNGTSYEDLSEVIQHVRRCNPQSPMALLGFSLGALISGNYLSAKKTEARSILEAAMLISAPWNVFIGTSSVEKPYINMFLNRNMALGLIAVYDRKYILNLKGCNSPDFLDVLKPKRTCVPNFSFASALEVLAENKNRKMFEGKVDRENVLKSRSLREFDERFTVKAGGFRDLNDYYSNATIHNKIQDFSVPTLCLSAADDPFQPISGIPIETAMKTENVGILITPRGGHVGFLEGLLPFSTNQYMFRVIGQFLSAMFHNKNYAMFKPRSL